ILTQKSLEEKEFLQSVITNEIEDFYRLHKHLFDLENSLLQIQEEKALLHRQLEETEQRILQLQGQLQSSNEENSQLKKQLEEKIDDISQLNNRVTVLEEENLLSTEKKEQYDAFYLQNQAVRHRIQLLFTECSPQSNDLF